MQKAIFVRHACTPVCVRTQSVNNLNASNLDTFATNVLKGSNGVISCNGLHAEFEHVETGIETRVYLNGVLVENVVLSSNYPVVDYDGGYARIGTTVIKTEE